MSTTPGAFARAAFACSTETGRSNSTLIASLWATFTGTRTHVGQTPMVASPRIFFVSLTTLFSSSV